MKPITWFHNRTNIVYTGSNTYLRINGSSVAESGSYKCRGTLPNGTLIYSEEILLSMQGKLSTS